MTKLRTTGSVLLATCIAFGSLPRAASGAEGSDKLTACAWV